MRTIITRRRLRGVLCDLIPGRARRRIGFMHVPRTSGTGLVEEIGQHCGIGRRAYAFDRVLFGEFDGFEQFSAGHRRLVHLDAATLPRRADFLAGHMARSTLRASGRDELMTVLREPCSRLLSHWLFWRNHSAADLGGVGSWGRRVELAREPLQRFLSHPAIACQTDNVVTRMLLWPHPAIPDGGFIDPRDDARLIDEAVDALDGFAFADVLENPSMRADLQHWLGKTLRDQRRNATVAAAPDRTSSLSTELTPHAAGLVEQRCRLDQILWQHLASRRLGSAAAKGLRATAECAGYQRAALLLGGAIAA